MSTRIRVALVVFVLTVVCSSLLARAVASSLSFDEAVLGAAQRDDATAVTLPQNSWWCAHRAYWMKNGDGSDSTDILRAEVKRRRHDGLIVIRPLGWYVYYVRGDRFYYFSGDANIVSRDGGVCASSESAAIELTPIIIEDSSSSSSSSSSSRRRRTSPSISCLNCSKSQLFALFGDDASASKWNTVPLDEAVSRMRGRQREESGRYDADAVASDDGGGVTLIDILNYLISLRTVL